MQKHPIKNTAFQAPQNSANRAHQVGAANRVRHPSNNVPAHGCFRTNANYKSVPQNVILDPFKMPYAPVRMPLLPPQCQYLPHFRYPIHYSNNVTQSFRPQRPPTVGSTDVNFNTPRARHMSNYPTPSNYGQRQVPFAMVPMPASQQVAMRPLVVMMPPPQPYVPLQSTSSKKGKLRAHALEIIDPVTKRNILEDLDIYENISHNKSKSPSPVHTPSNSINYSEAWFNVETDINSVPSLSPQDKSDINLDNVSKLLMEDIVQQPEVLTQQPAWSTADSPKGETQERIRPVTDLSATIAVNSIWANESHQQNLLSQTTQQQLLIEKPQEENKLVASMPNGSAISSEEEERKESSSSISFFTTTDEEKSAVDVSDSVEVMKSQENEHLILPQGKQVNVTNCNGRQEQQKPKENLNSTTTVTTVNESSENFVNNKNISEENKNIYPKITNSSVKTDGKLDKKQMSYLNRKGRNNKKPATETQTPDTQKGYTKLYTIGKDGNVDENKPATKDHFESNEISNTSSSPISSTSNEVELSSMDDTNPKVLLEYPLTVKKGKEYTSSSDEAKIKLDKKQLSYLNRKGRKNKKPPSKNTTQATQKGNIKSAINGKNEKVNEENKNTKYNFGNNRSSSPISSASNESEQPSDKNSKVLLKYPPTEKVEKESTESSSDEDKMKLEKKQMNYLNKKNKSQTEATQEEGKTESPKICKDQQLDEEDNATIRNEFENNRTSNSCSSPTSKPSDEFEKAFSTIPKEILENPPTAKKEKECSESSSDSSRITYDEGQSSPSNSSGKIQYKLEQLMQLRNAKASMAVPKIKTTSLYAQIRLMPSFARGSTNGNGNYRHFADVNKVHRNGGSEKHIILVNLPLNDVKLKEADNAWRPKILTESADAEIDPEEKAKRENEQLTRRVRGILNKLTPEKFEPLVKDIIKLNIDTIEKVETVMILVFEKAIDEPNFSASYASLCHRLITEIRARDECVVSGQTPSLAVFHRSLLVKAQHEFIQNVTQNKAKEEKLMPIRQKLSSCTDEYEKAELKDLLEEQERKLRRRSGGTMCFIGELFKLSMITAKIISSCIDTLLKDPNNEDMLECLCKLLTTVGKKFDESQMPKGTSGNRLPLDATIKRMQNIVDNKANSKISSRIRFMLEDVIDLRKANWQSKKKEIPKTMGQIEKEIYNEKISAFVYYDEDGSNKWNDQGASNTNRKGKSFFISEHK